MKRQLVEHGEVKYWDNSFVANPGTGGVIDMPLIGLAQGTTEIARIGRKIRATHFSINGIVTGIVQAGAAPLADLVRIIVVLDKQADGAAPVVTDVLKTATINSHFNLDNDERFQVLDERWIRVDITAWGGSSLQSLSAVLPVHIRVPLNDDILCSSTAGAQGEFRSKQIAVLYLNRNGESTFSYQSRLLFTDA